MPARRTAPSIVATALLAALLAGCAGPAATEVGERPTRLETASAARPAPTAVPAPASFDAKGFVAGIETPADCEQSAREVRRSNPDQGWALLRACVEKPRFARGPFVQLGLLTSGAWDEDLQNRPDAAVLVGRIIASRGGDVEGDLPALQKNRVPVFSLSAALRQPEVYKGRWVVLRGAMGELRSEGPLQAALIYESSLQGATREMEVGPKYRSEYQSSVSGNATANSSRYGSASASGNVTRQGSSSQVKVERRFENEKRSTGRQALGRLAKPDPFLEPGQEFVFVGRFDGVRPAPEGETAAALVTLVGYFAPAALVVQ
jgi:hypothetical protein